MTDQLTVLRRVEAVLGHSLRVANTGKIVVECHPPFYVMTLPDGQVQQIRGRKATERAIAAYQERETEAQGADLACGQVEWRS